MEVLNVKCWLSQQELNGIKIIINTNFSVEQQVEYFKEVYLKKTMSIELPFLR